MAARIGHAFRSLSFKNLRDIFPGDGACDTTTNFHEYDFRSCMDWILKEACISSVHNSKVDVIRHSKPFDA